MNRIAQLVAESAAEQAVDLFRAEVKRYLSRLDHYPTREEFLAAGSVQRYEATGDFIFLWNGRPALTLNFRNGTITEHP